MEDKKEELKDMLKKYPNRKLIFVYPGEGDESHFYVGTISSVTLDEYHYDIESDLEYFKSDGHENFILKEIDEGKWVDCIKVQIN